MVETVCSAIERRGLQKEGLMRATGNPHWLAMAEAHLKADAPKAKGSQPFAIPCLESW